MAGFCGRLPRKLFSFVLLGFMLSGCASGLQCAPYARLVTGLPLNGPAAGWWDQSEGRFSHADRPVPGAVLVLRSTSRLPDGHVSVVRAVLGPRQIVVEQANWEPGRIDRASPVIDVSAVNDWSLVRVWWRPSRSMGRTMYPAYGFILPRSPG
ncbi:CHAP domain-containing protein [Lichenicola cladoniae]|uniref:CHAP domain-containing protein n=1 Tax=Lichenicola cladoniae TaxID=1484109 RepID=A0A6M8HRD8_9PROT|nr:CHAP domain-containing protein [Acetobacteraceae bacterium]QKE90902.1 CHAP domain-containing protein [Lichenicola cladoniae]